MVDARPRTEPVDWKILMRVPTNPLCWATSGSRAVREGDWKLVAAKNGPWERYDLSSDRTDLRDLAGEHPERVQRLEAVFRKWEQSAAE